MKKLFLSITLLVFSGCSGEVIPEPEGGAELRLSEAGVAEIDAFLMETASGGDVPKIVAMVTNADEILYEGAFGWQAVADGIEMKTDGIFNLASMTKPVTSVATMMLIEDGAFELDDPIAMYLSDWADRVVATDVDEAAGTFETEPAASEITIRHLLSNTSGLAYDFSSPKIRALMDLTGQQEPIDLPLVAQPGTEWNYSASTAVLGELIAEISGMPLDEFVGERIFAPLGMDDTFYAVPPGKRDRVVTTHRLVDGELIESPVPETVQSAVRGDGGLYGTAGDYVRFLQMLLNEGTFEGTQLLAADSVAAMLTNQIGAIHVETQSSTNPALSADFPLPGGRDQFGLGFLLTGTGIQNTDLRSPGSYSWAGIFNTHFWGDPDRDIAGVVLMQQLPFYSDTAMGVVEAFEERVNRNLE